MSRGHTCASGMSRERHVRGLSERVTCAPCQRGSRARPVREGHVRGLPRGAAAGARARLPPSRLDRRRPAGRGARARAPAPPAAAAAARQPLHRRHGRRARAARAAGGRAARHRRGGRRARAILGRGRALIRTCSSCPQ
eukprot:3519185-Prymnesium_polylepis.1